MYGGCRPPDGFAPPQHQGDVHSNHLAAAGEKGYLTHEEEARAYVYRAVQPARSIAAHAVRQIIDRFCRGSIEELVSGMVDAKVLSKSEMERL